MGFVTQTTLSVEDTAGLIKALQARFPAIQAPAAESICYATTNRQEPHTYGSLPGDPYFLAGNSQETNVLEKEERRNAWAFVAPDQFEQLEALAREGDTRALKGLAYARLNPAEGRYDPAEGAALSEQATRTAAASARVVARG